MRGEKKKDNKQKLTTAFQIGSHYFLDVFYIILDFVENIKTENIKTPICFAGQSFKTDQMATKLKRTVELCPNFHSSKKQSIHCSSRLNSFQTKIGSQ